MTQIKVLISIILVLELFGFSRPVLAQINQTRKQIIVIDPGHGGKDSGAVGLNGILERDVVLNIAKQIVELNEIAFKNQFEIYLTRYNDTLISLGDRTKLAKILKADIFISLHCNHSDNPNTRGVEVFVSNKRGKYSRESVLFAYDLQKGLKENIGFESRGVKFADFQVLRETNYFPSVLLELGFLSNYDENNYLKQKRKMQVLALLIMKEIFGKKIKG
ncbi:MAG: N-acetylmuramoyl-L-alanine amidase [Pusillimonas sp.]|nr:N-acetylmuramoyl-L-alanine amidase [Pusillimonas sp.]|tara:strand:- start:5204 stop:5860 length:657 start_codon:yes stop_codon:yes gene_type:complete